MMNTSVLPMYKVARRAVADATMFALYRQDNDGYVWLKTNFPHLATQLDDLTFGWVLLPKSIVSSTDTLQTMVQIYHENMQYGTPSYLPDEMTAVEFKDRMGKILSFLTDSILPVLQRKEESEHATTQTRTTEGR